MQYEHLIKVPLNIIEFRPDVLEVIRKTYNLDQPGRLDEAIDILEAWVRKQDHFTRKEFGREFYERIIIHQKGNLERAKAKIDKICTLRTLMPKYFEPCSGKDLKDLGNSQYAIIPKQTDEYHRIYLVTFIPEKYTKEVFLDYCRLCVTFSEFYLRFEYGKGIIGIYDARKTNTKEAIHLMSPTTIRELTTLWLEGYPVSMKQVHFLTNSKLFDGAIAIFKQLLSEKLASRVHCHTSLDTLYEFVPKDLLPDEYGGKMGPLEELSRKVLAAVSSDEHVEYMKMISQTKTDESKRNAYEFNEQHFGTPGSFRNLVVD